MPGDQASNDRISGLDLLRVILSFWVVAIHVMHYGGLQAYSDPSSAGFYLLWFLAISMHSVINCFALVSGFVLYDQTPKYTRILRLLFTVAYHGIVITLLFRLFYPEAVTQRHWLWAFFPVAQEEFWYFSSYFGAFFFVPVLIRGIRSLPKRQAGLLVICSLIIFSFIPTFTARDPFDLDGGNSVLWLLILFVAGAFLKKYFHTFKLKKRVLLAIFAGSVLLTCIGMAIGELFPEFDSLALVDHTSPTLVLGGIAVVLLFASIQVPAFAGKIVKYCAPFTFSIYLIHEHPLVRQYFVKNQFIHVVSLPAVMQVVAVFLIAACIWLICFGLDFIRRYIFRLLRINQLLEKLETKLLAWHADA